MISIFESGHSEFQTQLTALVNAVSIEYNLTPADQVKLENLISQDISRISRRATQKMSNPSCKNYSIDSLLDNPSYSDSAVVESILNKSRISGNLSLTYRNVPVCTILNESDQISYILNHVNVDDISPQSLEEAWKCDDLTGLTPLLSEIIESVRKEYD